VSEHGKNEQGAEHAQARDEGNKREVSEPGRIEREQSTHKLETRGIKGN
jgi:hypothetical protein